MTPYAHARLAIDAAHGADPKLTPEGHPAELIYADRMEAWVGKLVDDATPLLRLAARCQHLERWSAPRDTFPLDKVGYHAWRRSLYIKQAGRAKAVLIAAGVSEPEADEVSVWVAKKRIKNQSRHPSPRGRRRARISGKRDRRLRRPARGLSQ